MCKKKRADNISFLDENIHKELRSVVNSSKIFYWDERFRQNNNLICAVLDRIQCAVEFLNAVGKYPKNETVFISFMVYSCMIVDGVKLLNENMCHQSIRNSEAKYFLDVQKLKWLNIKEDDYLCDDDMFEWFRSLTFAHPFNTNRKFKEYFGDQVSPWVFTNKGFSNVFYGIEDAVGAKVYIQKPLEDGVDTFSFVISFKKLKDYVNSRYLLLNSVIQWMKDETYKVEEGWKSKKVDRTLSPEDTIVQIHEFCKERFLRNPGVSQLYYYLICPVTNSNNNESVNKYRNAIIAKIPDLCDAVDELDENKIHKVINDLTKAPRKMHIEGYYQMEKIYLYLDEQFEYTKPIAGSNEEWGRIQAGEFAKKFAKKWVTIDNNSMCNSEIKLLVATACYLEKQKKPTN